MNFSKVRTGELKEVFNALEEAFEATGTDYYMIGAIARDIWYSKQASYAGGTKDVDFAALVGSQAEYEAIRTYLQQHKQFRVSPTNAFVLFSPDDIQIDILPFGEIEIDDAVGFEGAGLSSIKVNGFKEVYNEGTEKLTIETGHQFKVATLPAIILLKLIAYDDRPEKRHKDPRDIANMIQHYFNLESDLIYDNHSDLFGEDIEERSLENISAVVIGREIRKIIHGNKQLLERITGIVEREMTLAENSGFVRQMVMEADRRVREVNEVVGWLRDFQTGLGVSAD